jgi:hypothetical protein
LELRKNCRLLGPELRPTVFHQSLTSAKAADVDISIFLLHAH